MELTKAIDRLIKSLVLTANGIERIVIAIVIRNHVELILRECPELDDWLMGRHTCNSLKDDLFWHRLDAKCLD